MKIKLQLEPGKKLVLDLEIDSSASVIDLQKAINELNSTKDPNNLHIVYKSPLKKYPDILEEDKLLSDYSIGEGSVVKYLYQKASTGETVTETKE
jgi:hypothetical protein